MQTPKTFEFCLPTEQDERYKIKEDSTIPTIVSYLQENIKTSCAENENLIEYLQNHEINEEVPEVKKELPKSEDLPEKIKQLSLTLYEKGVIKNYNLLKDIETNKGVEYENLKHQSNNEANKDHLNLTPNKSSKLHSQIKSHEKNTKSKENNVNDQRVKSAVKNVKKFDENGRKFPLKEEQPKTSLKLKRNLGSVSGRPKPLDLNVEINKKNINQMQKEARSQVQSALNKNVSCSTKSRKSSIEHKRQSDNQNGKNVKYEKYSPLKAKTPLTRGSETQITPSRRKMTSNKSTSISKSPIKSRRTSAPQKEVDEVIVHLKIVCYPTPEENIGLCEKKEASTDALLKTLKQVKRFIDKESEDNKNLKKLESLLKGT